ncbi:aminoglycoside phosphotransferase family protein [Streptomyces sodiiphilus]|uniref:Aminoglycoside phosphotransferase family protein n=1 Tax=Streptomyces sodiiphilus TaxID=226217 RepID=A0ABN2NU01_9ACTN
MASALRLEPPLRLVRAQEGPAGDWLASLPALAEEMLGRWELTAERVVAPGGRAGLIVLVRCADGSPAALKVSAPGSPAELENAALRRWDGRGAVRVLRCAPESGALLLERAHGEVSLRSLPEAKAMLETVSAGHRLWVDPGEYPFPTVAERTAAGAAAMRTAAVEPELRPLVDEALAERDRLLETATERFLLHGDLRQGAVLASDSGRSPWLAVGPEPVVGERAFDLARLARDRLHDLIASPGGASLTRRRVAALSESVEVTPERLRGWALYRAVDSAIRHLAAGQRQDAELLLEFAAWL